MRCQVEMRDGTVHKDLTYEEVTEIITENPTGWFMVTTMDYGCDLDEKYKEMRKKWMSR